jgi:cytochrome bd-type quinol oxidase subunit 2
MRARAVVVAIALLALQGCASDFSQQRERTMTKWILLAISVALICYFIYRAVAYQGEKAEAERRDNGWD